jgi:hypothetical protein
MCLIGFVDPGLWTELKSMPIVIWLSGPAGTRSKRNFHRPESNCGMALNCGWRVFIVLQSRLQLQIHQRQSKIATPINGLSTANQKEMFQSDFSGVGFLFMSFSQAFEDQHFRKFRVFLRVAAERRSRQQTIPPFGPRR